MKQVQILTVIFASLMLMLSGCAKKDSEFASRYARNKMGAKVVDGSKAQTAGETALSVGLEADIVGMQKTVNSNTSTTVTSYILINNQQQPVSTTHSGGEVVAGDTVINGYKIRFTAMCVNSQCEPYYAMMDVSNNSNQRLIQVAVRKYFFDAEKDTYQWLSPTNSLPFIGSSIDDASGMVGFLNLGNSGYNIK